MRPAAPAAAFLIRRARPADAAAILALEEHFPGDRMSPRSVRALLRSPAARVFLAQARAGGKIHGALILLTRRGSAVARIYSVVVGPGARGQGLGKRLVLHAERAALRLGCGAVSLEVREDNDAARGLYAALGYCEHGQLHRYYEDGTHGLRLRRPLRPAPDGRRWRRLQKRTIVAE